MKTLTDLAQELRSGETTSEALVEQCLAAIDDPAGEGARAFIEVYRDGARRAAIAADKARARGKVPSLIAGIPISIKDLFDVAGDVTRAGSIILANARPAERDAPAIARLKAAGLILMGRTNMTEFAYGGHGTNSHYGTPLNAWDRATKRIPGGSTSGGAVSVTDRMAAATIGSDTGGSVRIPAALCGLVGYKPTQARVPLAGAFPLSPTRDSIGPLGVSANCCVLLDRVMADEPILTREPASLRGLTFGVPTTIMLDKLDREVERAFASALTRISRAGATIKEFVFQELQDEADGSKLVNFSGYEAYQLHRGRLETQFDQFDPRVAKRLMLGAAMKESDYRDLQELRLKLMASADKTTLPFDGLLAPAVPIVAPALADLDRSDDDLYRINSLTLRNAAPYNVLNRPAWSLPCHQRGEAPVGLMVVGQTNQDAKLQRLGVAIEEALSV
ncbi:MAG: amidase [Rhodocyclaceae bacterium]|nr:amidase [Rhodocyclaceae bacterium]